MGEGDSFEEGGKEEVPLEVQEHEELVGSRHGKTKKGDDPSFYILLEKSKKKFIAPFWL